MKKSSLLSLAILLSNTYCMANVLHVTTGQDSVPGSLRTAVAEANPGDIIEIDENVQLLTLEDGEIAIQKNLTLRGASKSSRPVIDGQNKNRILEIAGNNLDVSISNINFTHGKAVFTEYSYKPSGGAIATHTEGSKIEISDADFYQNNAEGYGGAIFAHDRSMYTHPTWVILTRVNLHHNQSGGGGAIYNIGASVKAINSTLSRNTALKGGAIWTEAGCLDLRNSSIIENQANLHGGMQGSTSDTYMRLENVLMRNNASSDFSDIEGGLILKMQNSKIFNLVRPLALASQGNNQITHYTEPEQKSRAFISFQPTDSVDTSYFPESLNLGNYLPSVLASCASEMMK